LHATALVILRGGHQPGIAQDCQRLGNFGTDDDLAVLETGFVAIAEMIMRREGFRANFQRQLDCRVEGVATVIGIAGEVGKALDVQQFVQQKGEIVSVDDLLHGKFLEKAASSGKLQASSCRKNKGKPQKAKPERGPGFACCSPLTASSCDQT